MTITAGTKLGRYEIRSKIGAGGMGEVYLAKDTKLVICIISIQFNQSWRLHIRISLFDNAVKCIN
jgi:serine/threonine protein kinase